MSFQSLTLATPLCGFAALLGPSGPGRQGHRVYELNFADPFHAFYDC